MNILLFQDPSRQLQVLPHRRLIPGLTFFFSSARHIDRWTSEDLILLDRTPLIKERGLRHQNDPSALALNPALDLWWRCE
jgi:hypothetical protein